MPRRTPGELDSFSEQVLSRLSVAGEVRARRMFGGVGLYMEEHFFALIAHGRLYYKVDDSNRERFLAAEMEPFQPFEDKPYSMSYYELPPEVLENDHALREWTRASLAAARNKPRVKKSSKQRSPEKRFNLGPVSRRWLAEVDIRTRADLERSGSVATYLAVRRKGHETSLNLLYALEGALLELRWDRLSAEIKANLRQRAGLE